MKVKDNSHGDSTVEGGIRINPNPDEVSAIKFVNESTLKMMMSDPTLRWSPWFRIIADNFLTKWWKSLDDTMNTDEYTDYQTIHRL